MKFTSKINEIFNFSPAKKAEGAEVWIVSWEKRNGDFSSDTKRVAKAFLNYEDALAFVQSLKDAQDLLQNTNRINIQIEKQA